MKEYVTVHHIRESDVAADLHYYCGRGSSRRKDLTNARLGNPFPLESEAQRDAVCDRYERMLDRNREHRHWPTIRKIAQEVLDGKTVALYCFCAPKRCHCETIRTKIMRTAALLRDPLNPFIPSP